MWESIDADVGHMLLGRVTAVAARSRYRGHRISHNDSNLRVLVFELCMDGARTEVIEEKAVHPCRAFLFHAQLPESPELPPEIIIYLDA